MLYRSLIILLSVFSFSMNAMAQCTTLGQTPGSAFPVCGTTSFSQTSVPICSNTNVPTPCTDIPFIADKNPFWYKFHCFADGSIGFRITPANLGDDYDWQIFDVTNRNPDDVYTDPSLFVSCNWSGLTGVTGASASGTSSVNCSGNGFPLFSDLVPLIQGHDYLLLVSHWTDSQSGYSLSFNTGSNIITDTLTPALSSAAVNCSGTVIRIKTNKKMKCASLAANGSDFTITPAGTVISALGAGCSNSFDMDSIILTLAAPLPAGNYTITMNQGSDGNTLLDNCANGVPVGTTIDFLSANQPPVIDSISANNCATSSIKLFSNMPVSCTSVAADGRDFIITGPSVVNIISATANCSGSRSVITLQLSSPVYSSGNYSVQLSPANALLDLCGRSVTMPAALIFNVADTVSANFNYVVHDGCVTNVVDLSHDGNNGTNSWDWSFNGADHASSQNLSKPLSANAQYDVQLIVSNGVCNDTSSVHFSFNNGINAAFSANDIICPEDSASFRDQSLGNIISWNWAFGNGNSYNGQLPPAQHFPRIGIEKQYTIRLIVGNNICLDTAEKTITVLKSCYIDVPSAFTPNGDGTNDFLYPLNAFIADNLDFKVFNRWGVLLFHSIDYRWKWDGTYKGKPQEPGTYIWTLSYINRITGRKYALKGVSVLLR